MPVVGFIFKQAPLHLSSQPLKCNIRSHINQDAMQIHSDINTEKT